MFKGVTRLALGLSVLAIRQLLPRDRIDLAGRVVLITGGSRGLGLCMARELADHGARLAILARDEAEVERGVADLQGRGATVLGFAADVRDPAEATRAVQRVIDHYGQLDVLINNAGVIQTGPLDHMSPADFDESLKVHFWGPLHTMLAAIPHMRARRAGRIVNISSIGGKIAVPHLVPYCTGKFALAGLSDGMRAELARDNIRVTTVFPGLMRTGAHFNSLFRGQHEDEFAWFSIVDSLPVTSIDARRAARQIIAACRNGDPQLIITMQARALVIASAAAPNIFAYAMALFNRLLPEPTGRAGDETRTGWESQSAWAPSVLTALSDKATVDNNEQPPLQERAQGEAQ